LIDWDSAVEQVNSEKNEKQIQEMKLRIMVQRKLKEETESMEAPFAKPEMPKNTDDLEDREDEQTQENERG
jgi:hypothetical protein